MRPDCTAGPGDESRDTVPPLSGVPDRMERLLRLLLVAVSPGELDLDSGRVNVTSDLLRFLPPETLLVYPHDIVDITTYYCLKEDSKHLPPLRLAARSSAVSTQGRAQY